MFNCTSIDPLVTPYVDGELSQSERSVVDEHLRRCASCQSRIAAEASVRDLLRTSLPGLTAERAPTGLRDHCCAMASAATPLGDVRPSSSPLAAGWPRAGRGAWRARWPVRSAPIVLAASLVLLAGGAVLHQATRYSSRVLAAELAADHVKCFAANRLLGTHHDPAAVERSMLSMFDWRLELPEQFDRAGLELIGSRLCLYGEGRAAHLMYRDRGEPVSIFMLPQRARPEELVDVLGHEAAIWSSGDRTFVLVTRRPRAEVERLASFVKAALQ